MFTKKVILDFFVTHKAGAWNYFEEAFGTKIDLLSPHKNMIFSKAKY